MITHQTGNRISPSLSLFFLQSDIWTFTYDHTPDREQNQSILSFFFIQSDIWTFTYDHTPDREQNQSILSFFFIQSDIWTFTYDHTPDREQNQSIPFLFFLQSDIWTFTYDHTPDRKQNQAILSFSSSSQISEPWSPMITPQTGNRIRPSFPFLPLVRYLNHGHLWSHTRQGTESVHPFLLFLQSDIWTFLMHFGLRICAEYSRNSLRQGTESVHPFLFFPSSLISEHFYFLYILALRSVPSIAAFRYDFPFLWKFLKYIWCEFFTKNRYYNFFIY